MKLVSGIVDSGFFAQSALSAEVATKDSLGRNISETYLTAVDIPESANWNSTTETVSSNSASWGQGGGGLTGDYVSGVNLVKVPYWEGGNAGQYYSANISGDVAVAVGNYENDYYFPGSTFSLLSMYNALEGKLNSDYVMGSNTIANVDNHAEVAGKAYRQTGFEVISAEQVQNYGDYLFASLVANHSSPNARLYSAIVIVETTASGGGSLRDGWSLASYENNSAIFTKFYSLNYTWDSFDLHAYDGWGEFTNCEASAMTYSSVELAPIAFKDDIAGITYTTGSI